MKQHIGQLFSELTDVFYSLFRRRNVTGQITWITTTDAPRANWPRALPEFITPFSAVKTLPGR